MQGGWNFAPFVYYGNSPSASHQPAQVFYNCCFSAWRASGNYKPFRSIAKYFFINSFRTTVNLSGYSEIQTIYIFKRLYVVSSVTRRTWNSYSVSALNCYITVTNLLFITIDGIVTNCLEAVIYIFSSTNHCHSLIFRETPVRDKIFLFPKWSYRYRLSYSEADFMNLFSVRNTDFLKCFSYIRWKIFQYIFKFMYSLHCFVLLYFLIIFYAGKYKIRTSQIFCSVV